MKLLSFFFFVCLYCSGQTDFSKDLLLYYPYCYNTLDFSGNNFDGVPSVGVSFIPDQFGNDNAAMYFDGNSSIRTPYDPFFDHPDSLTISLWVYKDGSYYGNDGLIVDFGYARDRGVGMTWHPGVIAGDTLSNVFYCDDFATDGTIVDSNQYANDVWHHQCLTYDGDTLSFYMNGSLVGGQSKNGPPRFWKGGIDNVRFYSRALSFSEVKELYELESQPTCPDNLCETAVPCPEDEIEVNGLPNIISPNNDGMNDAFVAFLEDDYNIEGEIYNRWGNSIFTFSEDEREWMPSDDVASGVYFYSISYYSPAGNEKRKNGFFHLVR